MAAKAGCASQKTRRHCTYGPCAAPRGSIGRLRARASVGGGSVGGRGARAAGRATTRRGAKSPRWRGRREGQATLPRPPERAGRGRGGGVEAEQMALASCAGWDRPAVLGTRVTRSSSNRNAYAYMFSQRSTISCTKKPSAQALTRFPSRAFTVQENPHQSVKVPPDR